MMIKLHDGKTTVRLSTYQVDLLIDLHNHLAEPTNTHQLAVRLRHYQWYETRLRDRLMALHRLGLLVKNERIEHGHIVRERQWWWTEQGLNAAAELAAKDKEERDDTGQTRC